MKNLQKTNVIPSIINKNNPSFIVRIPFFENAAIDDVVLLYIGLYIEHPRILDDRSLTHFLFSKTYSISNVNYNGEYDIWYSVTDKANNHSYSEVITLKVKYGPKHFALAAPSLPDARGGILDIQTVAAGKLKISLPSVNLDKLAPADINRKIELIVRIYNKDNIDNDKPNDVQNIIIDNLPHDEIISIKEPNKFRKVKVCYSVELHKAAKGSGTLRQKYTSDSVTAQFAGELKLPRPKIVENSAGWVALHRSKPEETIIAHFESDNKTPFKAGDQLIIVWKFSASYGGDDVKEVNTKDDLVFPIQTIPSGNLIEYNLARSEVDRAEAVRLGLVEFPGSNLYFRIEYKLQRNKILIGQSLPNGAFIRFYD